MLQAPKVGTFGWSSKHHHQSPNNPLITHKHTRTQLFDHTVITEPRSSIAYRRHRRVASFVTLEVSPGSSECGLKRSNEMRVEHEPVVDLHNNNDTAKD